MNNSIQIENRFYNIIYKEYNNKIELPKIKLENINIINNIEKQSQKIVKYNTELHINVTKYNLYSNQKYKLEQIILYLHTLPVINYLITDIINTSRIDIIKYHNIIQTILIHQTPILEYINLLEIELFILYKRKAKNYLLIQQIIGSRIYRINDDILNNIIDMLWNNKSHNIIKLLYNSTNVFRNHLKNIYCYSMLYINNYVFRIHKNILAEYNITIEQLLYVPLSSEGRSILHLLVRTNNINSIKYLYNIYPNLNMEVGTKTHMIWCPIHNSVFYNYIEMTHLLLKIGINNTHKIYNKSILSCINNNGESYYIFMQNLYISKITYNYTPINIECILENKILYNDLLKLYGYLDSYSMNANIWII